MTPAALAAEYVEKIGYDPFAGDPSIAVEEVARTLAEHDREAAAARARSLTDAALLAALAAAEDAKTAAWMATGSGSWESAQGYERACDEWHPLFREADARGPLDGAGRPVA